jgi:hypothetical protein
MQLALDQVIDLERTPSPRPASVQADAKVFKTYSRVKRRMDGEALPTINQRANESRTDSAAENANGWGFATVEAISHRFGRPDSIKNIGSSLKSEKLQMSGRSAAW